MRYTVHALFPTATYEVDTYLEVVKLKDKKHGLIYMHNDTNLTGYKPNEIIIIKSTNAYYAYIVTTEQRLKILQTELQEIQTKIDQEQSYANKLTDNFKIDTSKNMNFYQNGSTTVLVEYYPRCKYYRIICTRIREKKTKLTVNILADIELIILRLLFNLPITQSEYIIDHAKSSDSQQ